MSSVTASPDERADAPAPPERPTTGAATRAGRRQRKRRRRQAATGATGVDRADRLLLGLIGLIAIGLGTVALLEADDRIGLRQPRSLYADARESAIEHQEIWTGAAIAAGILLVLLGLWWAWAQVRLRPERGRLGETVVARQRRGQTSIEPAPVARALAADVAALDGVTSASARLVALGELPEVLVSAQLEIDADVPRVRSAIEVPLARMAAALGVDAVDAELRFRVGRTESARVV